MLLPGAATEQPVVTPAAEVTMTPRIDAPCVYFYRIMASDVDGIRRATGTIADRPRLILDQLKRAVQGDQGGRLWGRVFGEAAAPCDVAVLGPGVDCSNAGLAAQADGDLDALLLAHNAAGSRYILAPFDDVAALEEARRAVGTCVAKDVLK